ncbi:hydroxyethylthiazole kinase [Rhizobium sp. RU35A]|uniref:hydroxyethylthiazole kinase n=1 Tax=Rhizobium sp. RU35A TaxID=1907414 RepID=UPI000953EDF3|nr:hydroxyethylthiazole kinase [Rhizobium sp. RU35A]SIQ85884.1 hydroxyethylthiazole kinase [Rhizobium sp. RU35A]
MNESVSRPTAADAAELLARVRARRPRVHCLMNSVVQKFTADGITAVGAIPSMTSSLDEIADFVARADVLTVNLGTLDAERRHVIRIAVDMANAGGKPWILDPVHCDYSPGRLAFARDLIALGPTVVRGNRAEMALIGEVRASLAIETGPVDHLSDGSVQVTVENGHAWMAGVTGTGCLSGGVIAAFLAVEGNALKAAAAALAATGVAAELAAPEARGPGSFGIAFLDTLASLSADDLLKHARIRHATA